MCVEKSVRAGLDRPLGVFQRRGRLLALEVHRRSGRPGPGRGPAPVRAPSGFPRCRGPNPAYSGMRRSGNARSARRVLLQHGFELRGGLPVVHLHGRRHGIAQLVDQFAAGFGHLGGQPRAGAARQCPRPRWSRASSCRSRVSSVSTVMALLEAAGLGQHAAPDAAARCAPVPPARRIPGVPPGSGSRARHRSCRSRYSHSPAMVQAGALSGLSAARRRECGSALRIAVEIVGDRSEVPPAFIPVRLELEGLPVERQRLLHLLGVARRLGLPGECLERGRRALRRTAASRRSASQSEHRILRSLSYRRKQRRRPPLAGRPPVVQSRPKPRTGDQK